ncbi:MAG: HigA family addiction module antidote protein [Gemmatimonadetes bacterium]|nr:HigA family addiction module antidote protein [Gemmatimonadota bacterium]
MNDKPVKIGMRPSHPGGFIRTEIIEELGLSRAEAAKTLNVRQAGLSDLLDEKVALSPEIAHRVEKAFGVSMDMLLQMQAWHDQAEVREWHDETLAEYVEERRGKTLTVYQTEPERLNEDFNTEESVLAGGYRYRQVFEVVQNAADAILEGAEEGDIGAARIIVRLNDSELYVANTGAPLTKEGIVALLGAHSSSKRKNQIGRFGLGFKSLLALNGKIDLFSRSVSIRFDPLSCQQTIRNKLRLSPDYLVPGLRIAEVVSFEDEARQEPQLAEFGQWATTVLRAQVNDADMKDHLHEELRNFPREFVLFLPVDVSLELNFGLEETRRIKCERSNGIAVLHEGEHSEKWLSIERIIPVTNEAAKDAGRLHGRPEVPLIWAVPLNASEQEAGRFWAFFPTDTFSRVPGIINAPWKIDFGRSALSPGAYNEALMQEAAALIAESMPQLRQENDPGCVLDIFPRQLDSKDEPAAPLVEALWDRLVGMAIIPDGTDKLRYAEALSLHPFDDFELVSQWLELVKHKDALSRYVHPSCLKRQRLARLKELRSRTEEEVPEVDLCDWLEAACTDNVAAAKKCLSLVAKLSKIEDWQTIETEVRQAKIVLSDRGQLVAAKDAVIGGTTEAIEEVQVHCVEPALLADTEVRKVLTKVLSVPELDNDEWKRRIKIKIDSAPWVHPWQDVWRLVRAAPASVLEEISDLFDKLKVHCRDDSWRYRHEVLLPGRIVSETDSHLSETDSRLVVDMETHEADKHILKKMGISDLPISSRYKFFSSNQSLDDYEFYIWQMREEYQDRCKKRGYSKPRESYIDIIGEFYLPYGGLLVQKATGIVNARISEYFIRESLGNFSPIKFGHSSRPESYPEIPMIHPFIWLLREYGTISIESGKCLVPIKTIVRHFERLRCIENHPFLEIETDLSELIEQIPADYEEKGWRWSTHEEDEKFWTVLEAYCLQDRVAPDTSRAIYEWMREEKYFPNNVSTEIENVKFKDCYVTQFPILAEAALKIGKPTIVLSSDAVVNWIAHGAQDLEKVIDLHTDWKADKPVLLIEVIPEFREILDDAGVEKSFVRLVSGLEFRVADNSVANPCVLEAGEVWLDREQLGSLSWEKQMKLLVGQVTNAGWFSGDATTALKKLLEDSSLRLRKKVAEQASLTERLLLAVRSAPNRLLESFDYATRSAIPSEISQDGPRLAELALNIHGPAVLSHLSETLEECGLKPPSRWGTQEAQDFVAALGFPPEFAVSPRAKRPSELTVSGPMPLGDLHDYQAEIVNQLKSIVGNRGMKGRAVISLPTGAGKTRVVVEASVKHVLSANSNERYLLWVAQTDELCEQAVQSFRQVWSNSGREWTDLRVVRLWGGNPDPAPSPDDVPTAVIASIQTLTARLGADRLALLKGCALVVIDESHHAITPSYTKLLNWFLPEEEIKDDIESRPPVIGLTATPFRGLNEDETRRLANRFNQRMLPAAKEQPKLYERLCKDGILSRVQAEALQSKVQFEFTEEEREQLERFKEFPESALQRLAKNESRNERIVDCVRGVVDEGPILLFASSVEHAQFLAARLCVLGVPSASIHGGTETAVRQYFIRQFQQGAIKVLANYQVLTTGFDAPKTSTIVIARPVFSPVRYMQMIGRGLRGPKNGGTDVCKIITVVDNLLQYGDRLAYHYFMKYYPSRS